MTFTTIVGLLQVQVPLLILVVLFTQLVYSTTNYPKVMNALFVRSKFRNNNLVHHFAAFAFTTPITTGYNKFHSSSFYHTVQQHKNNLVFKQMNSNNNNDNNIIKNIDLVATNNTTVQVQSRNRSNSIDSNSTDDSNKRIQLPIVKYGYRTVPFTWDELQQIILVEQNLDKLTRSIEQQTIYEIYKRDLLLSWTSVTDHLLCTKFNTSTTTGTTIFQKKINPLTNLAYAVPSIHENTIVIKIIVQNDFPYYIENNIEHWILWKLYESCTNDDIENAKKQLCSERSFIDILHWTNPIHLKSIPSIDHVHILGKLSSSSTTGSNLNSK